MGSCVNKKNSQEIELHGIFKDAARNNLPGSPDADRKGEDRLHAENGGNGFPCTSI